MKTLAILCFMVSVVCFGMGSRQPVKPKPVKVVDTLPPIEVTAPSGKPMLIIGKCTNCTAKEIGFIRNAELKMNETVKTECFQDYLSSMPLIQTNGLSAPQVAKSVLGAGIEIDVTMYYTEKRVLGYTLPSAQREWINRRYMLEWNVCDLGSLLAHETSHKAGYKHDYERTKRRPNSVPYSVNRAFKACCQK